MSRWWPVQWSVVDINDAVLVALEGFGGRARAWTLLCAAACGLAPMDFCFSQFWWHLLGDCGRKAHLTCPFLLQFARFIKTLTEDHVSSDELHSWETVEHRLTTLDAQALRQLLVRQLACFVPKALTSVYVYLYMSKPT